MCFVWTLGNKGTPVQLSFLKAFGWHQHFDNIPSKQTAEKFVTKAFVATKVKG